MDIVRPHTGRVVEHVRGLVFARGDHENRGGVGSRVEPLPPRVGGGSGSLRGDQRKSHILVVTFSRRRTAQVGTR